MNKIKVIDLLNKIANGEEVPKKIQVYSDIFVFDDSNRIYEHNNTRTNLLSIYNGNILNYEVEIIGEDKKIEKIDLFDNYTGYNWTRRELCEHLERNFVVLNSKINEIIDYIKENDNEN